MQQNQAILSNQRKIYDIFALPNPQEQQTQSTEILTKINQKQISKQLTPYFPLSMVGCRNIWLQTHFDKHAIVTFNKQILPWLTLGRNLNLQLNTQISVDATNTCILLPGTGWLQKCGTPVFCRQMVWTTCFKRKRIILDFHRFEVKLSDALIQNLAVGKVYRDHKGPVSGHGTYWKIVRYVDDPRCNHDVIMM